MYWYFANNSIGKPLYGSLKRPCEPPQYWRDPPNLSIKTCREKEKRKTDMENLETSSKTSNPIRTMHFTSSWMEVVDITDWSSFHMSCNREPGSEISVDVCLFCWYWYWFDLIWFEHTRWRREFFYSKCLLILGKQSKIQHPICPRYCPSLWFCHFEPICKCISHRSRRNLSNARARAIPHRKVPRFEIDRHGW